MIIVTFMIVILIIIVIATINVIFAIFISNQVQVVKTKEERVRRENNMDCNKKMEWWKKIRSMTGWRRQGRERQGRAGQGRAEA